MAGTFAAEGEDILKAVTTELNTVFFQIGNIYVKTK